MKSLRTYAMVLCALLCLISLTLGAGQGFTTSATSVNTAGLIQYHSDAHLLYSTSFEGVTVKDSSSIKLDGNYGGLRNYFSIENGGTWSIDSTFSRTGSKSIFLHIPSTASGNIIRSEFDLVDIQSLNPTDETYISVWNYITSDWNLGSNDWFELFNPYVLYDISPDLYPRTCVQIGHYRTWSFSLASYYSKGNEQKRVQFNYGSFEQAKGTWVHWEWWIKHDTTNGELKLWMNGQLLADMTGIKTKGTVSSRWLASIGKIYLAPDYISHSLWVDDLEIWDGIPY